MAVSQVPSPPRPRWRPPLPIPILAVAAPVVAASVWIWAASYPSSHLIFSMLGLVLGLVAAALLIVFGVIGLVRRTLVPAVIIGLVLLVGGFAVPATGLPLPARFALHRAAFDRVVAVPPDQPAGCPDWIGTYRIRGCSVVGTGYLYYEADGGFLGGVGFAYLPDGPERAQRAVPEDPTADGLGPLTYRPLTGRWYTFSDPW